MLNIPDSPYPRVVVIGAGFAGINLAKRLSKKRFQVVLLDKNNYHQFQPLLYQVAMAGLEPSSIIFPMRKIFQKQRHVHIRIAEVTEVRPEEKRVDTTLGDIYYDKLVIATGATTNYFGDKDLERDTFPMKSLDDALELRNAILTDLEMALTEPDYEKRQGYIDIVIVGGGATGVELAGALAEMKKYILPKDYIELNDQEVDIHLLQGGSELLMSMSEKAQENSLAYLKKMGVKVGLDKRVVSFKDDIVTTHDGETIHAHKVIWAAGITGNLISGLDEYSTERGQRYIVDEYSQIKGVEDVYAIGDIASMPSDDNPRGHAQVAQVAIQQGINLAKSFSSDKPRAFKYKDYGSMATIGRNKAVADLGKFKTAGFLAWIMWLFVHLVSLVGFRNKVVVTLNWFWNYLTYDQSLRVIIGGKTLKKEDKK
ncbi:NAD(P)/FAD-dependent oxidoreductase [Saprospiraceae bacterium]|nr:NAD(P)/FAD-dependent oxidoreductase [Saprospiraceae bacterium]